MPDILPRSEYPRPQFQRNEWLCLNGTWQFEVDEADNGLDLGWLHRSLRGTIVVPFCPESSLSGVGRTEFLHAVWYRREIELPAAWAGRRAVLHFQACDYDSTVWADGELVVRHRGGFTPFSADLGVVPAGGSKKTVVLRARDPHRSPMPLGKQSEKPENYGCHYTRSTGIWQTVWLEPLPLVHLKRPRITPDLASATFTIELPMSQNREGFSVRANLIEAGNILSTVTGRADLSLTPRLVLAVPQGHVRPWQPDDPHLYDLSIELIDEAGIVVDAVQSYAGLRSIAIDGKAVKINGESVFQRLVLDQGYYPDGIYTAPTDAALKRDIELSLAAGFNGARLHQKVFEERFLYWADRLGYLVWGEFADWGGNTGLAEGAGQLQSSTFVAQWIEALERDYSHPSIVGWCPLNETVQPLGDRLTNLDEITQAMFLATKAADGTRPVIDASGWAHRVLETDIYDSHDYDHDPVTFAQRHAGLAKGQPFINDAGVDPVTGHAKAMNLPYRGQPYFVSEFGGIQGAGGSHADPAAWGYGKQPKDIEAAHARFAGLCEALLHHPHMFGYCYTQLTDVFQEQNGIYTFDRQPKFDIDRLKAIQSVKAAIESM